MTTAQIIRFPQERRSRILASMEFESDVIVLPVVRIAREEAEAPPSDGHLPGRRLRKRREGRAG